MLALERPGSSRENGELGWESGRPKRLCVLFRKAGNFSG